MGGRAFVLHLLRASARRENARSILETCGLDGEIWPAVDGAGLSSTELASCVGAGLLAPDYPFALKTGEIGCFLSHRQIWAEIVRRKLDYGLILEDDATLDPVFFALARDLARSNIAHLGYIQFQTRPNKGPARLIDMNGACVLSLPRVGGLRTTAQMVSQNAAAHLLRLTESFDRPVDTFVQSHWHTGLRPATILPSGVRDIAEHLDGSTIQGSSRKTPLARLAREWARLGFRRGVARASRHSAAPEEGGLA
ncbi:glycosyltransferase family 25 protein [uncultured Roseovarius sp.]|uniref:glycosyltransferase family 25 protein n=1 Tax=uncultured Roseovarius sp. TaxID=293344 RepID=UPI00260C59BC|nr:glycosyltransferase family 25 protein [uncultured Roseovarius sp.]